MKSLLDLREDCAKMGNYKLTSYAEEDLWQIYHWGVRTHGQAQADIFYNAIFDRFEKIAEQPNLYQAVDYIHEGYRRSVFGKHSIYYRIRGGTVEIIRLLGRQDPDKAL